MKLKESLLMTLRLEYGTFNQTQVTGSNNIITLK